MTKVKICIEESCHNAQTTEQYCRLHYLKNWKKIRQESQKKAAERLNKYVEGIVKKHPEKYVDVIRREIREDKGEITGFMEGGGTVDAMEEIGENMGFQDEDSLDRLISKIKLDRDF